MAAQLIAGGDSFVWGSELQDSPHGGPDGYSRNTFAALLANKYNLEYRCAAYPGLANDQIVERIKFACDKTFNNIVIVSWTWPTRNNKITADEEIIDLQTYLIERKISYLFTCADNCVVTDNPKILWDNWFLFPIIPNTGWHSNENPRGFYQWALEHKYELAAKDKHPLEQAHADAARLMKDKFYELVKKHLEQDSIRNSIP